MKKMDFELTTMNAIPLSSLRDRMRVDLEAGHFEEPDVGPGTIPVEVVMPSWIVSMLSGAKKPSLR